MGFLQRIILPQVSFNAVVAHFKAYPFQSEAILEAIRHYLALQAELLKDQNNSTQKSK